MLLFDRNIERSITDALAILRLPVEVKYFDSHFLPDTKDDQWLEVAGKQGWTVISHDRKWHLLDNELSAIKQFNVGCFYLWGGDAIRWQKMQCFAKAYDRIINLSNTTTRPFIFDVQKNGHIVRVNIP